MMKDYKFLISKKSHGQSLIELAIILPLLLMLVFGVIDYARAIQFNNILVAMSREGANLASRTSEEPRNIIVALNNTAEPLVMTVRGRVYITEIRGTKVGSNVEARVQAQTRSTTGGAALPSKVWSCPSWNGNGNCNTVPTNATATLPITLDAGEIVFAVETLYDYNVIVNYVMQTGPKLYSLTVL